MDQNLLTFSEFGLSESIMTALTRKGFKNPTMIQSLAIPRMMSESGHLVAKARTGTGKTAAFGLPLVNRFAASEAKIRALILTPTRELALQLAQELQSLAGGKFPRVAAVYGGAAIGPQLRELSRGVELLVGTPGRILDHLERGSLDLSGIAWLVLDEADEMLDMGFLEAVEAIMDQANPERRVALFSATMPPPILKIVKDRLGQLDIIEDLATDDTKPLVDQYYMMLRREDRLEALRRIIDATEAFHGLVFCATKLETDELARRLAENGYSAEGLHGDLSQEARERTLKRFRLKHIEVLVATDVAARGIDVERLSHVINWDLPNDTASYIHRIGRTGRAGYRGIAISFVSPVARFRLASLSQAIERLMAAPLKRLAVPSLDSLMAASRSRIVAAVQNCAEANSLDQTIKTDNPKLAPAKADFKATDPRTLLIDELLAEMDPRTALEALVTEAYGDRLSVARYKPIVEFDEPTSRLNQNRRSQGSRQRQFDRPMKARERAFPTRSSQQARVYVGVGRKHGASARDVAGLLMRAGGVAGRLIDGIDVRDFCAFATLPAEAAQRACALTRRNPALPLIRPASPATRQST